MAKTKSKTTELAIAFDPPLSDLAIAARLRAGKPFTVRGNKQRIRVLTAARFIDLPHQVTTRGGANQLFTVFFIPNGGAK